MKLLNSLIVLFIVLVLAEASPRKRIRKNLEKHFIGEGTNELATALVQGFVDVDKNLVFSPLAYSTILAIIAEGARGETRNEIATALHFHSDVDVVRNTYKEALDRLKSKNKDNAPEFKNWFYVYKNYTINKEFKHILREYYNTEVKSVDRPEDFYDEKKTPISAEEKPTEPTIPVDPEKAVAAILESGNSPHKADAEEAPTNNAQTLLDNAENSENKKESESVDNKQEDNKEVITGNANLQEKSQVKDEIKIELEKKDGNEKTEEKMQEESKDKKEGEEKEQKPQEISEDKMNEKATEAVEPMKEKPSMETEVDNNSQKESMKESEHEEETEKEIMIAMHRSMKSKSIAKDKPDGFSGMTDSSLKIKRNGTHSQMIVFNGLYFKGEWDFPFTKGTTDETRSFYRTQTDKVIVQTMHAEGMFKAGHVPQLDSIAIELPYKGDRYSLLILLPDSRDGLTKLVADLTGYSLSDIYQHMTEKSVELCLPLFEITTISKPISALSKLGISHVTKVFDPEQADLSGISEEPGLFVEELVQFVSFEVDSDRAEVSLLTASNAATRSEVEKISINHPFLFFLRDRIDNIIVVSGKLVDPSVVEDDDDWMKKSS